MSRYVVAPRAITDLDEIWDYVARDSIASADRLLDRFHELFRMLSRQPFIGESRAELKQNAREFPCGNYVIYYFPANDGIRVVRIIHAARDISSLM
jgi:toxin ParE1/3/4